jgi:hypothetical protein
MRAEKRARNLLSGGVAKIRGGARKQQVPHPAFGPVRNDKPFFGPLRNDIPSGG